MGEAVAKYQRDHAAGRFAGNVLAPRKGQFVKCRKFDCFYLIEAVSSEAVLVRTIGEGRRNHTAKVPRGEWPKWCERMNIDGFRWGVR